MTEKVCKLYEEEQKGKTMEGRKAVPTIDPLTHITTHPPTHPSMGGGMSTNHKS